MEQTPTTDELLSQIDDCIDDCIDGANKLTAENARLRKALEAAWDIIDDAADGAPDAGHFARRCNQVWGQIRAALRKPE